MDKNVKREQPAYAKAMAGKRVQRVKQVQRVQPRIGCCASLHGRREKFRSRGFRQPVARQRAGEIYQY
ncbi:hypothetical protein A2223_00255 [Candidatus Falkowbacteria bacterium RIFOXYA2_FULL_35_8]|uniref:Uncharacterized protein n=1 Tax=Candidatus Falkowbacteria bacterium RIFOXYC2_FULL_36_12 TaxID=1798002 RepID=A0A1F5SYM8_9BACT|nr:MAG: hypothetical protein A2478_04935 [Candidatus Falkowbacteria bacterium RIFOXYC2_FULL_36_12]OGF33790.1 MAG: hypothetical protein A2223_00255 [Candidatus Falkowbacteria bacterium RIFOXYA2_FULL_35_8]